MPGELANAGPAIDSLDHNNAAHELADVDADHGDDRQQGVGQGVAQDDAKAFALFRNAAEQGNNAARIKLGYMYINGRGTPQDLEAAYSWIQAASSAGDQRGEKYLVWLKNKLGKEQIERAEMRAEGMEKRETGGMELALALALAL